MVELANCLAEQPQWVVDRLAGRHLGVTAKHKTFPPAIGEIVEMIGHLHEMEARHKRYEHAQSRRQGHAPRVSQPFRPFPKLWEVFADEPEIINKLDHPTSFDFLNSASRTFATRGKDAARKLINPPMESSAA